MDNTISYPYDNLKVMGVMGQNIFVKPEYIYSADNEFQGCLVMSMTKWVELQKCWLKQKKGFCERYEHFCGVGDITSHYTRVGEIDIRIEDEIQMVPLLKPFDFLVDMEHG